MTAPERSLVRGILEPTTGPPSGCRRTSIAPPFFRRESARKPTTYHAFETVTYNVHDMLGVIEALTNSLGVQPSTHPFLRSVDVVRGMLLGLLSRQKSEAGICSRKQAHHSDKLRCMLPTQTALRQKDSSLGRERQSLVNLWKMYAKLQ